MTLDTNTPTLADESLLTLLRHRRQRLEAERGEAIDDTEFLAIAARTGGLRL